MKKPQIIVMVGNIGSGKSTTIKLLKEKGLPHIVVSRDALRYMIGAGKYTFDINLEKAIWDSEKRILENFMLLHRPIIVDEVGVSKKMRARYIKLAKRFGYSMQVICMPMLDKKTCVDRRMNNPHDTPDRAVWESVWDKFNRLYQKPELKEGIDKIIVEL